MIIVGILFAVFGSLLYALLRAIILFWPTMVVMGAVHSYIPIVPSLGWQATFLVVMLISLLIPTATSKSSD